MEKLLSDDALSTELSYVKNHLASLSNLKQKFAPSHVPATVHRPKRATLANVPVIAPPAPLDPSSSGSTTTSPTVTLTLKSLKPPLLFTLPCPTTSTIATLKSLLSTTHAAKGAPKPEEQRWILKGKAMGDGKLLKEFDVQEGSVVNLMIKAAPAPAPPPASSSSSASAMDVDPPTEAPSLTLSEPHESIASTGKPILTVETPEPKATTSLENSALWKGALSLLRAHTANEDEARETWEAWFDASVRGGKISPSEKAKIREVCEINVMGGL